MNYRTLGQTGLKISTVGLGSWLTYGGPVDEQTACACVRAAFDAGVNFFDTADVYGGGRAELVLGKAIQSLPRNQIVVASKCRFRSWPGPLGAGLSRKHIVESVEASLRRLGVDYLDLYQTHYPDADTPVDETLRALDDLRAAGKVLAVGASNYYAHELAEAMLAAERAGVTPFQSLQQEYSMLFRVAEMFDLPFCRKHNIGVVTYSPLAEGVLTGKYKSVDKAPSGARMSRRTSPHLTDENLARVRKLRPVAKDKGCTVGQLAIAWVLANPALTCAITGASRPEQVAENAKAAELDLSAEDLERLEEALGNKPRRPW